MPLNVDGLKSDLQDLFANSPFGAAECARKWADAMEKYAKTVAPPADPLVLKSAATTMATSLEGFDASGMAATKLETAFLAFGVQVGAAIAHVPPVFVSKPPTAEVGFAALFNVTYPTAAAAASAISAKIHTWMQTGTSAPTPPGTVFSNWA